MYQHNGASTDTIDELIEDVYNSSAEFRRKYSLGQSDSCPLADRAIKRANKAREDAKASEIQKAAGPQKTGFLSWISSSFFSKAPDPLQAVKDRNKRILRGERTMLTSTSEYRERNSHVSNYTYNELYFEKFDSEGSSFFTVKLTLDQLLCGTTSNKECVYERSRLLRYLCLKFDAIAGKFATYHHPGDISEYLMGFDKAERNAFEACIGALPDSDSISKKINELLNRTIHIHCVFHHIGDSLSRLVVLAKEYVNCYDEVMHLPKSKNGRLKELDSSLSSWDSQLKAAEMSWPRHRHSCSENKQLKSRLLQPNMEKKEYNYALLKQGGYRFLLYMDSWKWSAFGLEVLWRGTPESLGIECKRIDGGAFGTIEKCILKEPKHFPEVGWPVTEIAVKTIRMPKPRSGRDPIWSHCMRTVREIRSWHEIKHDCVVPLLGIWVDKDDSISLCTVSPWIQDGRLDHYINLKKPSRLNSLRLMKDIACGLDYMHNLRDGVVHGDLKPDNVLIRNGKAYLTDFGLSHIIDDVEGFTSEMHGNDMWIPPEAINAKSQKTFEGPKYKPTFGQDMYSFGCLFLHVVYRRQPFWDPHDEFALEVAICAKRINNLKEPPSYKLPDFDISHYQLMLECWRFDPMLRIPASLAHQILQSLIDLPPFDPIPRPTLCFPLNPVSLVSENTDSAFGLMAQA